MTWWRRHFVKRAGDPLTDFELVLKRLEMNVGSLVADGGEIVLRLDTVAGALRGFLLAPPCGADTNGDGIVNLVDVQVVGLNWSGVIHSAAVPEPSSMPMPAVGICGLLAWRRST